MKQPAWMKKKLHEPSTRERSDKQESRIAKDMGGRKTINSGATFKQNDVETDTFEIEAKTTKKSSFSLNLTTWDKMEQRTPLCKIPLMVIDFEEANESFAVIKYEDFLNLIKNNT